MITMNITKVKSHLLELARQIESNPAETIVIERNGKPVLAVISYKEYQKLQRQALGDQVRTLREELQDSGINVRELLAETRKDLL